MTLPIPVSDLAANDFVVGYGTIKTVVPHLDADQKVVSIDLLFWNTDNDQLGVDPHTIMQAIQGGVMPDPSIGGVRPGLAEDHANGR